jgi:glycosyltransferase involved in cell wall biosynthesis
VVPTLNNGQDFRYEYNLQSIYNQNYTNYKVVVIDDASKDSTY